MLSYAQNAEDVVLARAFAGQPSGFYIDVGADQPALGSVTEHFYDRGWHGINIQLGTRDHALLCEARPRDINLRLGVSGADRARLNRTGEEDRRGSTLRPGRAEHSRESAAGLTEVDLELATLADVCARHVTGPIDFLKIDVEGCEEQVIRGGDWVRYRPRVAVVAATEPGSTVPSHASWEPLLLAADYQLALFDGVNRFYVRSEDARLLPRLAVPANVHDAWEPHRYVSRITEMERYVADLHARVVAAEDRAVSLQQRMAELEGQSAERERYAIDAREHFERCQAWAEVLEAKVRRFERYLGLLPGTLPPSRPG